MQMIHIVFATVKRMNKKLVMQQILFSVDAGLRIRNNELHFEMKLWRQSILYILFLRDIEQEISPLLFRIFIITF